MPAPSHDIAEERFLSETPLEVRIDAVDADADPRRVVKKLGPGFWIAAGWMALLVIVALLVPILPIDDPNAISREGLEAPPSWDFWFGGDAIGRDIFARVLWGARVSLTIGFSAVGLGFLIGGTLGLTAGYFGGRYERIVIGAMDTMLAFPALVLALALVTFLSGSQLGDSGGAGSGESQGASVGVVILTLTILAIPSLARITRAATLNYRQREFVTAARSLGARNGRILWQEILPNVVPPMLSFALIAVAVAIVAEGTLSFLGLSVAAPTPTWGNMIDQGRGSLSDAPWISLIPCAVMFITLLSLNYAGDKLQSYFDVREAAV